MSEKDPFEVQHEFFRGLSESIRSLNNHDNNPHKGNKMNQDRIVYMYGLMLGTLEGLILKTGCHLDTPQENQVREVVNAAKAVAREEFYRGTSEIKK